MAEGDFIDSIGELTDENFSDKMKEFENKFGKDNFSVDGKTVKFNGEDFKFNDDFFKSKDEFIKEQAGKSGSSVEEVREQAEKDLRKILDNPTEEQITQLQNSYFDQISIEVYGEDEPLDPEVKNIDSSDINDISDESKPVEDRLKSLEDLQQKISESNEKIGKKLDSLQSMSKEEFQKAIDDRIEKTTNESEKGRLERIKEEVKNSEKPGEETSYGKYILLALLGAGFLNAEMIANSGCMLSRRGDNSGTCRALDFTIINKTDTSNKCDGLPSLCQNPVISDSQNNKCQPNFSKNPIMKDNTSICSEFCDQKYLINKINNNNVSYNCVKCDIICAFTNTLQTLLNIVKDVADDTFDILKFIAKWAPIIGYIILGFLVLFILYKLYIFYNESKSDSKEVLIKVDNPTNFKFFSKNKSNYKYGSN